MNDITGRAEDFSPEFSELVHSTTLYVCTILGDFMSELVVAGGLVPSLIVPQESLPEGADRHVGTRDLDIGFSVAILDEARYHEIAERLRASGFGPERNPKGNETFQRWKEREGLGVTIDFLIPITSAADVGGTVKNLEPDFAAFIVPGLEIAFRERILISLTGMTIYGEDTTRDIWVCGPGVFVILKALAFRLRGFPKDAYDLFYIVRNYGSGPEDVAQALTPHLELPIAQQALQYLSEDFAQPNSIGPVRVALFMDGRRNKVIELEVAGFVGELLRLCRK